MRRYSSALAATIAAIAPLIAASAASAATLSRQAADLLTLDAASSEYAASYSSLSEAYGNQATSHSLSFEDWFTINSFINHEKAAYGSSGAQLDELVALDINALTWETGIQDVEVFFVNEGAANRNKLGYATTAPVAGSGQSLPKFWNNNVNVIWSDLASPNSILAESNGPLTLGQGYRIGDVAAGSTLNFFLRNPGNKVFDSLSAETTQNADGLQHVTTYRYGEYLVLAYEDIYNGGDMDYNDVVIAVRGLADTETVDVPEPTGILALLGLSLVGAVAKRQRQS